jgi:hypothetical protein
MAAIRAVPVEAQVLPLGPMFYDFAEEEMGKNIPKFIASTAI